MISFTTKNAKATGVPQPIGEMVIQMVKDLEMTREKYHGYAYVRTMRNILVGKEDAAIAPHFKDKAYYGIYDYLELEEVEKLLDAFVSANSLSVIFTEHGKLYCTHEYHDDVCRRNKWDS